MRFSNPWRTFWENHSHSVSGIDETYANASTMGNPYKARASRSCQAPRRRVSQYGGVSRPQNCSCPDLREATLSPLL